MNLANGRDFYCIAIAHVDAPVLVESIAVAASYHGAYRWGGGGGAHKEDRCNVGHMDLVWV